MNSLTALLVVLALLMIGVAKRDGLRNLIGLALNFVFLLVMITLISWGLNALVIFAVMAVIILSVAIFMSSADDSKIAIIAFKSSLIPVLGLLPVAKIIQYLGQFQGFSSENTDELQNLSLAIGLNFADIAIAVMVMSMIGAVAESSLGLAASLSEVVQMDRFITLDQFKHQRAIISQQMLGTAVNTLFFGTLGTSLGLLLWFVTLEYRLADIVNSKLLMAEIAAMLLGMVGILLSIEISGYYVQKEFIESKKS